MGINNWEEGERKRSWADIFFDYAGGITQSLGEKASGFARREEKKMTRRVFGAAVTLMGIFFISLGVSRLANQFLALGEWPGYLAVGIVLAVFGLLIRRSE